LLTKREKTATMRFLPPLPEPAMKRLIFALALTSCAVEAATPPPAPPAAAGPAAAAAVTDGASIDSIVAALYDVISGPPGQARDWDRFRALFMPGATMRAIGVAPDGSVTLRSMTPEDYIAHNGKTLVDIGFIEHERARRVERFGQLASVWTTYEARKGSPAAAPFMRGINSIVLYHDGQRWWLMSVVWQAENPKLSLPEAYLRSP
jgi:hypothetical protein